VYVARKIGAPGHKELGIGAVAEGSDDVVVTDNARDLGLDLSLLPELAGRARDEIRVRVDRYRGTRPLPPLNGRDLIVVDDGLATGVTAQAALTALRRHEPRQLVLAVPVGAPETIDRLTALADRVVCVHTPDVFYAVGEWYEDFRQTTDDEVQKMLPPR
jgi:putative phosphoribosyl transferase